MWECGTRSRYVRSVCPAWNEVCSFCKIKGHTDQVCFKRAKEQLQPEQATGNIKQLKQLNPSQSSSVTSSHTPTDAPSYFFDISADVSVPHMEWVSPNDGFQPPHPLPLPTMIVTVSIAHETHKRLDRQLASTILQGIKDQTEVAAYANSGAQICASGPELVSTIKPRPQLIHAHIASHHWCNTGWNGHHGCLVCPNTYRQQSLIPSSMRQQQLQGLLPVRSSLA